MISTDVSFLNIIRLNWTNPYSWICDRRDCDFLITFFAIGASNNNGPDFVCKSCNNFSLHTQPAQTKADTFRLQQTKMSLVSDVSRLADRKFIFFGRQQACCSTLIICKEDKKLLEENVMLTSVKSSTSFCSCPHFLGAEDIQIQPLTHVFL